MLEGVALGRRASSIRQELLELGEARPADDPREGARGVTSSGELYETGGNGKVLISAELRIPSAFYFPSERPSAARAALVSCLAGGSAPRHVVTRVAECDRGEHAHGLLDRVHELL